MIDVLGEFVGSLRDAGLPVSLSEHVDAAFALGVIDVLERETLRAALASTLVKHEQHLEAFSSLFELYFSGVASSFVERQIESQMPAPAAANGKEATRASMGPLTGSDIVAMLRRALLEQNEAGLTIGARAAVDRFGGFEQSRPLGDQYYVQRTLRHLDVSTLMEQLKCEMAEQRDVFTSERELDRAVRARIAELTQALTRDVRARLVQERGFSAVAQASQKTLPEDVAMLHASPEEMAQMEKALRPLSRKLAARLARRRAGRRVGALDMRRTLRSSLASGGVPLEVHFRPPHPRKPDLVVLADISGSVSMFARFTLYLVHALSSEFSKVRSFVFVDGLEEVTRFFDDAADPAEAVRLIEQHANAVAFDGHSDYGNALSVFAAEFLDAVSPHSTVLILGDARNNYHQARPEHLEAIARRAKAVHWLNPEPRAYWNSGDSVMGQYARSVASVQECSTLRQLEAFVGTLS